MTRGPVPLARDSIRARGWLAPVRVARPPANLSPRFSMNLSFAKSILWLSSLGAFGWLGFQLYQFKNNEQDLLSTKVTAEGQKRVIDEREQVGKGDDTSLVDYNNVVKGFHSFDWTGKKPPPPPPPPGPPDEQPRGRMVTPVDDLLTVLYIQVDSSNPEKSLALASPLEPKLAPASGGQIQLSTGEALASPFEYWVVEAIEGEGVRFAYLPENDEDPEREPQWASPPSPIDGVIVELGDGQSVRVPEASGARIPSAPPGAYSQSRPSRTLELSNGHYRLGEEDLKQFGDNYLEILSSEVRTTPHLDQSTKKWAGVELVSVAPGSLAAQHGAMDGDVVKSINGHPVNSVNEAINYAKNNSDSVNTWIVVVENAGIERTMTFESN